MSPFLFLVVPGLCFHYYRVCIEIPVNSVDTDQTPLYAATKLPERVSGLKRVKHCENVYLIALFTFPYENSPYLGSQKFDFIGFIITVLAGKPQVKQQT